MSDAPISLDKIYKTRDGREACVYRVDAGDRFPVHGAIKINDVWVMNTFTPTGRTSFNGPDDGDLVEVRPRHKRTVWLNIYRDCDGSVAYPTRNAADFGASAFRISCVRVDLDFEEGQFDV